MFLIENFSQLFQRKDFAGIRTGSPAEESNVIEDRRGEIALFAQICKRGRAMTLGQLFPVCAEDQEQRNVYRFLPAESLIEQIIFWS